MTQPMPQPLFSGVIPPVPTLFTAEGEFNETAQAILIEHLIDSPVDGLFFSAAPESLPICPARCAGMSPHFALVWLQVESPCLSVLPVVEHRRLLKLVFMRNASARMAWSS